MIRRLTKVFLGKENENTQSENVESFESSQRMFSSVLLHQAKKNENEFKWAKFVLFEACKIFTENVWKVGILQTASESQHNTVVHIAQERIADRRPCLYYNLGGAFIPKRSVSFVGAFDSYLTKNLHIRGIQVLQIFYSKVPQILDNWLTNMQVLKNNRR